MVITKSRAMQTNGPYLKRYRHGVRRLVHVQELQRKQMKTVALRRRKIWNRFTAIGELFLYICGVCFVLFVVVLCCCLFACSGGGGGELCCSCHVCARV